MNVVSVSDGVKDTAQDVYLKPYGRLLSWSLHNDLNLTTDNQPST